MKAQPVFIRSTDTAEFCILVPTLIVRASVYAALSIPILGAVILARIAF